MVVKNMCCVRIICLNSRLIVSSVSQFGYFEISVLAVANSLRLFYILQMDQNYDAIKIFSNAKGSQYIIGYINAYDI